MKLRVATTSDVPALAALNAHVQDLHVEAEPEVYRHTVIAEVEAQLREVLKQDGTEILLMEIDSEPVGSVVTREVRHDGSAYTHPVRQLYVDALVVAPSCRRRGVGRALMNAVAARASERNLGHVVLDVRAHNAGALAFYQALGYAPMQLRLTLPIAWIAKPKPR